MISFDDILKNSTKNITDNSRYIEFWATCITETLTAIKNKKFDISSVNIFLEFFIAGLQHKKLHSTFRREYILHLMSTIIEELYPYISSIETLYLLRLKIDLQCEIDKKENLIKKYKSAILSNTSVYLDVKKFIFLLSTLILERDVKKCNIAISTLSTIEENKKNIPIGELLYIVYIASDLVTCLYANKNYTKLLSVVNDISAINEYTQFHNGIQSLKKIKNQLAF